MVEGLYSAAAGMAAQQQRLDSITNDIANVSTTGYQAQRLGFRDLLYSPVVGVPAAGAGTGAGAAAELIGRSETQGAIQDTGQPLDVAIQGPGYLEVRRPDGSTALTRDGALQVDAGGRLTTKDGLPLQPPITLPAGTPISSVTIAPDGTISAAGRALGRLAVVTVAAPDRMLDAGAGLLVPTAASGAPRPATGTTLRQGALEGSNVDIASAMVDMMDAQRSYSLGSRAIQIQDQMLEIANGVKR